MSPTVWHSGGQRLVVIVGPSGAGKDTVINAWLAAMPKHERPHRARRTITRPADRHEEHEPIDADAFHAEQARGRFATTWTAHGLHYGVRWEELAALARGECVVLNGSRAHLPELRALAPAARVVEITAPTDMRDARLGRRGREGEAERRSRVNRALSPFAADLVILNDGPVAQSVERLDAWWRRALPKAAKPGHC